MKDINMLHVLYKYLLGGRVTFGERAFGQILTLSDQFLSFIHFIHPVKGTSTPYAAILSCD